MPSTAATGRAARPSPGFRSLFSWLLLGCVAALLPQGCLAKPRVVAIKPTAALPALTARLPTLTTARAAHDLRPEEAAKRYPVRLRAVVTYYDPLLSPQFSMLFVCDASGCVYVGLSQKPAAALHAGDLVEVTGESGPGSFEPIVDRATALVIGTAPLPARAKVASLTELLSGKDDGQLVEVKGVVRSAEVWADHVSLNLALSDGFVVAMSVLDGSKTSYDDLVDATVTLRGNASPSLNRQNQMTGFHVWFPGRQAVAIEEPALADAWKLPVEPILGLLRDKVGEKLRHRVHVQGTVTLLWPGRMICVQDKAAGLCAQTLWRSPVQLGETADVIGFATVGDYHPLLVGAIYSANPPRRPAAPTPMTASDGFRGLHDAELVAIEATVVGRVLPAQDPTLLLSSGGILFTASLPTQLSPSKTPEIEVGSLVRVTGICSLQSDGTAQTTKEGYAVVRSIRISQRSANDIEVLRRPSWWNAAHTLRVLAAALVFALAALWIVAILGYRVRQQKVTIGAQLAETHALKEAAEFSATHDSLTGLRNRRSIFEALRREYHLACRAGTTTGIMMLDLDHFKRVNDTYGHGAGDDVLKEAARRILEAARQTDLVGRYGGEEFLIVLPNCSEEGIRACGERIRSAICGQPIAAAGLALPVTTSLGAVAARFPFRTEQEAVAAADKALYEAKNTGRNRLVIRNLDSVDAPDTVASAPAEQTLYIC